MMEEMTAEKPASENLPKATAVKAVKPERQLDYISDSAADTIKIGSDLLASLQLPALLILSGTLGSGKTTLVKGIAEALGAAERDEVTSPTFTLVHEYEGTRDGKPVSLYHLDLYRLETERQVEQLGIDELMEEDAIVLVEWGEKFPSIERRAAGTISLVNTVGDQRRITVTFR
jgi:tRNA threonylcarbamoyladenosine biosynthesis protein TsaE